MQRCSSVYVLKHLRHVETEVLISKKPWTTGSTAHNAYAKDSWKCFQKIDKMNFIIYEKDHSNAYACNSLLTLDKVPNLTDLIKE